MRRLLGALLALALVTSGAHAKGLVIVWESTSTNPARGFKFQEGFVGDILRERGGDFDAMRSSQFKPGVTTQNLRRGKVFNGVDTTTYNPIVHVGYYQGLSTSLDSLICVRNYCSVAHLFIGNIYADNGAFANAAACTVGVTGAATSTDDSSYVTYVVGNPGIRWVQENSGAQCAVTGTRPTNGWRPLWGVRTSTRAKAVTTASAADWLTYDDTFDGTYPTNPDTVCFWSILNVDPTGTPIQASGQAAAVPMTFVMPTYKYGNGGELTPYLAGLLRADSLSGGALFPEAKRKPALLSIHIDDGWKRGDSRNGGTVYGGIEVRDTTYLKASIDSLAALNEKFVLGVEIDSLTSCWLDTTTVVDSCYTIGGSSTVLHTKRAILGATGALSPYFYPTLAGKKCSLVDGNGNFTTVVSVGADSTLTLNTAVNVALSSSLHTLFWDSTKVGNAMLYDGRWWARAPLVHYTPHCHAGTTTAKGQFQQLQTNAGPYWRMMDIWGTNQRVRTAWGGGTGLGRDSTFSILARRAFALLDSTFGAGKTDHVAMPPGDDWTPTYNASTGVGNWPLPMTLDSLLFAWDFAGGRGIRNNSATNTGLVSQRLGNYGMYTGTMDYSIALTATGASDHRGYRGRFVSCPSYPTSASSLSYSRLSAGKGIRAFNSVLGGHISLLPDPSSTTSDQFAKAQIIAIHVSDLGGDKYGRATRPGFYCIKYPVMASRAANAVARWTAIRWVYPEELCP